MILQLITLNILAYSSAKDVFDYCMPSNSTCWPTQSQWDELKTKITNGKLHDISDDSQYDEVCMAEGPDAAYKLQDDGQGRCMQYHDCSKTTCYKNGDWNVPEYSVEVSNENDIIEALKFANTHNVQVVVKTSGHNYAGASMGQGALLIWMRNYKKYGDITKKYTICDDTYDAVLKVGGGQIWEEAYKAVGNDYHLIGGGGLTVAAAGGWLMGGGLSASSRQYGMGIDQVTDFEVILANGTKVTASKCENIDLFWALRGGGGGSFGVTTAVHYKLHEVKPFCEVTFYVSDFFAPKWDTTTVYKWIDFLVDSAPTLDRRWGGYWGFSFGIFYFEGTAEDLKGESFISGIYALKNIAPVVRCDKSYFAVRGGPDKMTTDQTGLDEFNIASRLIPVETVQDDPDKVKDVLKWLVRNGFDSFNYIIGGKMMDISEDDTAVHPAMRKSCFQMEVFHEKMIKKLRKEFPDSGAGFNHAAKDEPNWKNQFWGSNLERLQKLKKVYDPDNRFNCWHCVGYLSAAVDVTLQTNLLIVSVLAMLTDYL